MNGDDKVLISGYLYVPGRKIFNRKRFYQIKDTILTCHRSEKKPPEWTLDIQDSIVTGIGGTGIRIEVPDRKTVIILAQNLDQFADWINALEYTAARKFEQFYDIELTIGSGLYSEVKIAREKRTKKILAAKFISKNLTPIDFSEKELKHLINFKHPHLAQVHDVYELADKVIVVMDCAVGGDIFQALMNKTCIRESTIRTIMEQILRALKYLHTQKQTTHRNLKPSNILVGKIISDEEIDVKVTDFGYHSLFDRASRVDDRILYWGSGCHYNAPEVFRGLDYDSKADMWSLGIIMYTLMLGVSPFQNILDKKLGSINSNKAIASQVTESQKPISFENPKWGLFSGCALSFVQRLLSIKPAGRPTAEDALRDIWFTLPEKNLGQSEEIDLKQVETLDHDRSPSMVKSIKTFESLRNIETPDSLLAEQRAFGDRGPTFVMSKKLWSQHNQSRTKMMYGGGVGSSMALGSSHLIPKIKSFKNDHVRPQHSEAILEVESEMMIAGARVTRDRSHSIPSASYAGKKGFKRDLNAPIENSYVRNHYSGGARKSSAGLATSKMPSVSKITQPIRNLSMRHKGPTHMSDTAAPTSPSKAALRSSRLE